MTATTFPWACKSDGTPVLTPRWVMIVLIKNWSERIWKGCSVGWLLIKLNYFVSSWCCFSHIAAVIFLVKHRTLFPNQPWCWEEHLQLRFALHCILLYASCRSRSLGFLDSCLLFLCGLLCAFESDNLFIVDFTGLQTALLQHLMHMHVKKWRNSSCTQQLLGSLLSADWHWVTTLSLHSVVRLTVWIFHSCLGGKGKLTDRNTWALLQLDGWQQCSRMAVLQSILQWWHLLFTQRNFLFTSATELQLCCYTPGVLCSYLLNSSLTHLLNKPWGWLEHWAPCYSPHSSTRSWMEVFISPVLLILL